MNNYAINDKGLEDSMDNLDIDLVNRLNHGLISGEHQSIREILDNSMGRLGVIANTRLAISGFWRSQALLALSIKDIDTSRDVENKVTSFIQQLDNQINKMVDYDDKYKDSEKYRKSLKDSTFDNLSQDEIIKYTKAIINIAGNPIVIETGLEKLNEWVVATRMNIVEDLWNSIQDYRESSHDQMGINEVYKIVDQIQEDLIRISRGCLFL